MARYCDPEAELKAKIQKLVLRRGGFYSRVPEGTFAIPGDPDLILGYKGYFIGCEAKFGTRQHGSQPDREQVMLNSGCIYFLCDRVEQVEELLDRIDKVVADYPRPPILFGDLIPDYLREPEKDRRRRLGLDD